MTGPPTPWDEPPVSVEVKVTTCADFLNVRATLMHPTKDGGLFPSLGGFSGDYESVHEPCWLFRLLGDTTEARVERAKAKLIRRGHRELQKRLRLARVAEASR